MATISTDDLSRIVEKAIEACSLPLPEAGPGSDGRSSLLSLSFEEIGFDSLNFMEFCISIAMEVGTELSVDDVAALKTPNAVIEHLSRVA
jgi:hypothetical protein